MDGGKGDGEIDGWVNSLRDGDCGDGDFLDNDSQPP